MRDLRVYVEGYGCAQNLGEAERLKALAAAEGHVLAEDPARADVGVLVTCAVIGSTEDRMVERWRELSSTLPHTIVTGCMVPLRQGRLRAPSPRGTTHLLPIRAQERLPELLREISSGEGTSAEPLGDRPLPGLPSQGPRSGGLLEIGTCPAPIPPTVHRELVLAQGCTSHCTYCFSRLARGPLKSTPLDLLRAQARHALDAGAVEVRLSSLDTSCWGEDLGGEGPRREGPRLPDLLRELTSLPADHDYAFRVGMMSPQSLGPIATRTFEALERLPHLFHFLHLPVQSGSDRILEGMRRGYRASDFLDLVERARAAVPELTLSTDVIVGFPGEEPSDQRATLSLLESVQPEILNVTRYSPRPLTPAARRPQITSRLVKERSREVAALRLRLARTRLERWVGFEGDGVVTEHGPEGTSVLRLRNYLPVVVGETLPLRQWLPLRVHGARSTYLLGAVEDRGRSPRPAA